MDVTIEKIQSKNACVMGPLSKLRMLVKKNVDPKKSRYQLIWIKLEPILRKQCSCSSTPVITSYILESITFLQPSTAHHNSPEKC